MSWSDNNTHEWTNMSSFTHTNSYTNMCEWDTHTQSHKSLIVPSNLSEVTDNETTPLPDNYLIKK